MTYLTNDQLLAVLKIAFASSRRDHLAILMAFHHALRAGETVAIRLSDIQDGALTVQRLKGSRRTVQALFPHRGFPLLDEVTAYKNWLKIRPNDGSDYLFPSKRGGKLSTVQFFRIFQRYAEQAGLPENLRHPHVLKHSAGNILVRNGADMAFVQAHLGHASISSTAKYIAIADAEASQRAATAFMRAF